MKFKAGSKKPVAHGRKRAGGPKSKPKIIHAPELLARDQIPNPLKTAEQREMYAKQVAVMKKQYLQPKPKSYHALGFAKESCWLDVLDPKFGEKFEVVFEEHINGWAGKSFKKQKTESDLNMEWRLRLKDKQEKDKQQTTAQQAEQHGANSQPRQGSSAGDSKASKKTKKNSAPTAVPNKAATPQAPKANMAAPRPKAGAVDANAQQRAIEMYRLMKERKKLQDKQQRPPPARR